MYSHHKISYSTQFSRGKFKNQIFTNFPTDIYIAFAMKISKDASTLLFEMLSIQSLSV